MINSLSNLNEVIITGIPGIYGNLNNLKPNNSLVAWNCWGTSISGDIAAFANLTNTTDKPKYHHYASTFVLCFTSCPNLYGDISILANMPNYNRIDYTAFSNNTRITGDISSLQACTNLRYLLVNT